MNALHSFRKGINVILSSACAVIFAFMVCIGTYQIVIRYFFNSPSTVSEELLTYSFVFGKRDHMRMGFLADKITGTKRKVLEIVIEILIMLLAGSVMIYGGATIMNLTMTQKTASLGIPMGIIYAVVPLSGVLIVLYSILNIVDLCKGCEQEHREVKE